MVSIPGGEPLLHPQMPEIVAGLVARKKYVYMCTNALLLKEKLHLFTPSKYLSFSVHVDGQREHHDFSVCREGGYDIAMEGVQGRGGCGLPRDDEHDAVRWSRSELGARALRRADGGGRREHDGVARATRMTRLRTRSTSWARRGRGSCSARFCRTARRAGEFNTHPLFCEFLMGKQNFECTPWGMPTFSIFGWQKPCYLLQDGYADTFQELMETTEWAELRREERQSAVRELHGALGA